MHPSIHSVWFKYRDAESILVDIPIDLPEKSGRQSDGATNTILQSFVVSRTGLRYGVTRLHIDVRRGQAKTTRSEPRADV